MKSKFTLDPKKLIAGKYFGQFQSIFSGLGSEMSDIRPYTLGDSAKVINWKATAKHQQMYSNVYHQERALTIEVFRDMNYNWNGVLQGKPNYERVHACMSDLLLYAKTYGASLNIFSMRKKGLFTRTLALQETVVGKSYDQAIPLITQLGSQSKAMPKVYISNIAIFLDRMNKSKKRRAMVIFSDFLDIDEHVAKQLHYIKKEHALVLFQLPVDKQLGQNYDGTMIINKRNEGLESIKLY